MLLAQVAHTEISARDAASYRWHYLGLYQATMTSLGFRVWRPCHAGNNAPKIELQFEAADEKSFACLLVWVSV